MKNTKNPNDSRITIFAIFTIFTAMLGVTGLWIGNMPLIGKPGSTFLLILSVIVGILVIAAKQKTDELIKTKAE